MYELIFRRPTEIGSPPTTETYNSLANAYAKGGHFQGEYGTIGNDEAGRNFLLALAARQGAASSGRCGAAEADDLLVVDVLVLKQGDDLLPRRSGGGRRGSCGGEGEQ